MFNITTKSIQWGEETLTLETGRVARQADGSVIATYGETSVMANVTVASNGPARGKGPGWPGPRADPAVRAGAHITVRAAGESGPTRARPLFGCIRFVPVDSGLQGSRHVPGDGANAPTRGPGRPRIDDKRSPRGGFNDAEWAKVKALAKAEGMTASAWVRARCGL